MEVGEQQYVDVAVGHTVVQEAPEGAKAQVDHQPQAVAFHKRRRAPPAGAGDAAAGTHRSYFHAHLVRRLQE